MFSQEVSLTPYSGDVHLAAIGQFYSTPSLGIPKDHDHRYMPNIISSAIVNAPPPEMLADVLNKRNKVHHLDIYTDEDMIPLFTHDVDGTVRNNKRLLPRRNWCSIREYVPGSTPPPTPPPVSAPPTPDPQPPRPPKPTRSISLSRKEGLPGKLFRRLSRRDRDRDRDRDRGNPRDYESPASVATQQDDHHRHRPAPPGLEAEDYFPPQPTPPVGGRPSTAESLTREPPHRPNPFHRRTTDLRESKKSRNELGDDTDSHRHFVNLQDGLDVTLNVEVNQKDPAGITVPYRLLVPALWSTGEAQMPGSASGPAQVTVAPALVQDEPEPEREPDFPQRKKSLRRNLLSWVGNKRRSVSQPQPRSYLDYHQGYDEVEKGMDMTPDPQRTGVTRFAAAAAREQAGKQPRENSWSEDEGYDDPSSPESTRRGQERGPYGHGQGHAHRNGNGDGVGDSETDDESDESEEEGEGEGDDPLSTTYPRNIRRGSYGRGGEAGISDPDLIVDDDEEDTLTPSPDDSRKRRRRRRERGMPYGYSTAGGGGGGMYEDDEEEVEGDEEGDDIAERCPGMI